MAGNNKLLPFMEGRNGKLIFVQNKVPKSYPFKTWSIKPIVVKHADGVGGEKRARLSKTLDYYELTGQMFVKDAEWIQDYLEAQAAEDAMTAPIEQSGAVRFMPNNGTRKSYVFDELIWDDWDFNQGGRTDKKMTTVNFRFTDLLPSKSV